MFPDPTAPATDDEREQTVGALQQHVGAGRLELRDFDARAAAAYAAKTHGDLQALVGDLPALPPVGADADAKPHDPGGHWRSWVLTGLIYVVIWVATSVSAGQLLYFLAGLGDRPVGRRIAGFPPQQPSTGMLVSGRP